MSIWKKLIEKVCNLVMLQQWQAGNEQSAYKKDKACMSRHYVLQAMLVDAWSRGWTSVKMVFVDFSQFFDTLRLKRISSLLRRSSIECAGKLAGLLTGLCRNTTSSVCFFDEESKTLRLDERVSQGGTWSPTLASFLMDESTCKRLKKVPIANNAQCRVSGMKCNALFFADDVVVCGRFGETVQRQMVVMKGQAKRDKTKLNVEKTKAVNMILDAAKDAGATNDLIDIQWVTVEQKYLGIWMDLDWCKLWSTQRTQACRKMELVAAEVRSMVGQWRGNVPWNLRRLMHSPRARAACLHGA